MGAVARPNAPTTPLLAVEFDAVMGLPSARKRTRTKRQRPLRRPSARPAMKLLHTADWHIGKRLYGIDRLDETRRAMDEIAAIARTEEVDAVLIAGDTLDRRLVEPAVLAACLHGFEALAAVAPVIAVTGNHEDAAFWREIAPYLTPRIRLVTDDAVLEIDTPSGRLWAACLPWPEPAGIPAGPGVERSRSTGDYRQMVTARLEAIMDELRPRRETGPGPAVLVGHLMVDHGAAGGGERELTLGGAYSIPGGSLPRDLDYVALGHLHRPQPLPGFTAVGRYAGSPMSLDFAGDATAPSVAVAEIRPEGTRVVEIPVTCARRLVRLRGRLEEIARAAQEHPDAWFVCEVLVDAVQLDLVREVRDRIPGALRVEAVMGPEGASALGASDPLATADLADAYAQWREITGRGRDPRVIQAFRAAQARSDEMS